MESNKGFFRGSDYFGIFWVCPSECHLGCFGGLSNSFSTVLTTGFWRTCAHTESKKHQKKTTTRWFKVTFSSASWRSLSHWKGSLNHPKKVTKNCQVVLLYALRGSCSNKNLCQPLFLNMSILQTLLNLEYFISTWKLPSWKGTSSSNDPFLGSSPILGWTSGTSVSPPVFLFAAPGATKTCGETWQTRCRQRGFQMGCRVVFWV